MTIFKDDLHFLIQTMLFQTSHLLPVNMKYLGFYSDQKKLHDLDFVSISKCGQNIVCFVLHYRGPQVFDDTSKSRGIDGNKEQKKQYTFNSNIVLLC